MYVICYILAVSKFLSFHAAELQRFPAFSKKISKVRMYM